MSDHCPVHGSSKDPMGISGGQLGGMCAGAAFILGVEYERFRALLESKIAFQMTVHIENQKRLQDLGRKNLREVAAISDQKGHVLLEVIQA